MQDFRDKVAVVTGAASGIGRSLAQRCADEGMRVVLADIEEQALFQTAKELESEEARVVAAVTDVSKGEDIGSLAEKTLNEFGAVHLLFNNAGVYVDGLIWQQSIADWEWVLGVNLWASSTAFEPLSPLCLSKALSATSSTQPRVQA